MRRTALLLLLALTALGAFTGPAPTQAPGGEVVVFLVRHAERAEDGTRDPPISQRGWTRAKLLADMLRDAGITHIHATDFRRTRQTALPASARTGVDVTLYDPRRLDDFAAELRATPGRHLVVGHSNTTPALVRALGGDPGSPIDEAEYDRLYIVTLDAAGGAHTVLLRFGAPFRP